jgi:ATP-dependent Zn protease
MSKTELQATAYHEAGHAIAAIRLGIGIGRKGVSIIPATDFSGSSCIEGIQGL